MRRIRYVVAASLDGYIAGPAGEYDWIPVDPEIDFAALTAQFDAYLMGRRTWEGLPAGGHGDAEVLVFSRTLRPEEHPDVTVVGDGAEHALNALRARPGRDIWLFGGGSLFASLLALGQVDTVEVAVVPVLLGGGVPLLPAPATRAALRLTSQRTYERSGIVQLQYAVQKGAEKRRTPSRKRAGR